MPFIVAMQPPKGPAEYLPAGFGYTCHAHTIDKAEAERFPTKEAAGRGANGYRYPAAFWESERRHRENLDRQFRGWVFSVEEIAQ